MKLSPSVDMDPVFSEALFSEHRALTLEIGEEVYQLADSGLKPAHICKQLGITIASFNLAMKRRVYLIDDSDPDLYP